MTGENHPSGTLMTDIVDRQTRSRMMSGIKGSNTKPELLIRKALHKRGFRYRLHSKNLAGKPDIVLPKYKPQNLFGSGDAGKKIVKCIEQFDLDVSKKLTY